MPDNIIEYTPKVSETVPPEVRETYWHAAVLRALLYFILTAGTTWTAATDGYTSESWSGVTGWEFWRLVVMALCAGIASLVGFLDKTMATMERTTKT